MQSAITTGAIAKNLTLMEKARQGVVALLLTFPALQLSVDEIRVLWLLSIIIIADSVVAIAAAYKQKRIASWKMGQPLSKKIALYGAALFTVFVLSQAERVMFGWMFEWMTIYLILSESLSIFENLSIFGFRTPVRVVALINDRVSEMRDKK